MVDLYVRIYYKGSMFEQIVTVLFVAACITFSISLYLLLRNLFQGGNDVPK